MLGVLSQASVANFDVTKLVFDDSEWVLDFGPDFGFHLLELLLHGRYRLLGRACANFCVNGADFS